MDEHLLIRGLVSLILILSIGYTGLIFKKLGEYLEKEKHLVWVQITGGLLMAFACMISSFLGHLIEVSLVVSLGAVGALLLVNPLIRHKLVKFSKVFVIQMTLVVLSGILSSQGSNVLEAISIVAFLVLIQSLKSIRLTDEFLRRLLGASMWLFVLYAWLCYAFSEQSGTCDYYLMYLTYFTALLLWFFSSIVIYENLRRWL